MLPLELCLRQCLSLPSACLSGRWKKQSAAEREALENTKGAELSAAGFADTTLVLPEFPEAGLVDAANDYVHDEALARRREAELAEYAQGLLGSQVTMVAEDVVLAEVRT
eukprot:SAG22_NODE_298_length_12785_cov_5.760129_18_plen_110_part_00